MYEVLRVARLRLALQRAFLRRAILIFTIMYDPFVKSNIFSSRCSLVVSDAIYLGCNIFRVTQYIWAAIFSE